MKIKYLFTWMVYGGDNTGDKTEAEVLDLTDEELKEYVKKTGYNWKFNVTFICIIP